MDAGKWGSYLAAFPPPLRQKSCAVDRSAGTSIHSTGFAPRRTGLTPRAAGYLRGFRPGSARFSSRFKYLPGGGGLGGRRGRMASGSEGAGGFRARVLAVAKEIPAGKVA